MRRFMLAAIACGLATIGVALAQTTPAATVRELYQAAIAAYEKKDYAEYLKKIEAVAAERPLHPILLRRLATAYALNEPVILKLALPSGCCLARAPDPPISPAR